MKYRVMDVSRSDPCCPIGLYSPELQYAVILDDFIAYDIATSLRPGHKVRVQAFTRSYAAAEVRNGRLADGELYGTPQSDIYAWR